MNNATKFVIRSAVGGLIGLAIGRIVQGFVEDNIALRKQIDTSTDSFNERMDTIREAMFAPQTLAERIGQYTEGELFWILDQHDDWVTGLETQSWMAAHDAEERHPVACECSGCKPLESDVSEPFWAPTGSSVRAKIDATNEHIRSAWGSTDGCTIVDCPVCKPVDGDDDHQDELNPAPFLAADARLARETQAQTLEQALVAIEARQAKDGSDCMCNSCSRLRSNVNAAARRERLFGVDAV